MMKDMMWVKVHQQLFWFIVCGLFIAAAGSIFWWNYSFDQEQKKIFSDIHVAVVHPPRPTIDISSWKTYENKKFGFHFRYPPELQPFSCYGQMLFCLNIGEKNFAFQDNGFGIRIYDTATLQSHDESGFAPREINGVSWRFKAGDVQAFRTDTGGDKEFRIFSQSQYMPLHGVVSTIQFIK